MNLIIETSILEERELFKQLLLQPDVLQYFPLYNLREVEDAVQIWEVFCKKGASLTAKIDGKACGIAFLNLQWYKKFKHQCLITIIVDQAFRNQGVGTRLLEELFILAVNFELEIIHLEVYEPNPAIRLYKRMGFKEFGIHKNFIKENGKYIAKILMERSL